LQFHTLHGTVVSIEGKSRRTDRQRRHSHGFQAWNGKADGLLCDLKKEYGIFAPKRFGKQDARMGKTFLLWVTEEVLLQVFANWPKFSAWVLDNKSEYLHGGHLIDRAGYHKFKEIILDGVKLNPEAKVADNVFRAETEYRRDIHLMPLSRHRKAGPGAAQAH